MSLRFVPWVLALSAAGCAPTASEPGADESLAASAGVVITHPTSGASLGGEVRITASAREAVPINQMQVWDNGNKLGWYRGSTVEETYALAPGRHTTTVEDLDDRFKVIHKTTISFDVVEAADAGTLPSPDASAPPPGGCGSGGGVSWPCDAVIEPDLDDAPILASSGCGYGGGAAGSGWTPGNSVPPPGATQHCTLGRSTPSFTGSDGGGLLGGLAFSAWGSALWYLNLGDLETATHAVYDTYVMVDDVRAANVLEIDINQFGNVAGDPSRPGSYRIVYGTQCDIQYNQGHWEFWDGARHWVNSTVPCAVKESGHWYHLQVAFHKVSADGHYVPASVWQEDVTTGQVWPTTSVGLQPLAAESKSGRGDSVDLQLGGVSSSGSFHVTFDKLQVIRW
jgi:hypothetical protein